MKIYENKMAEVWNVEGKTEIRVKPYVVLVPSVIASIEDCVHHANSTKFDLKVVHLKSLYEILTSDDMFKSCDCCDLGETSK